MKALIIIEAQGKVHAWTRIAKAAGIMPTVLATLGHMSRYPKTLFPIGIDIAGTGLVDPARRADPEVLRNIISAVKAHPAEAPIYVATDDDVEGDVIALDVIDAILMALPARIDSLMRLRPGAITPDALRQAIRAARPVREDYDIAVDRSIQGRARAVTDRWIGAAFSREAGVPVGRVRSAVLGSVFLWGAAPDRTRGVPETGEITFQARSISGGRFFQARVPLRGNASEPRLLRLAALAERFTNRVIPGAVRPRQSLSAAVAPRFGAVEPFNTGDALAYAARHHGLEPKVAMRGLQRAYLGGMISYPRTESRGLGPESTARVTRLGSSCGFTGFDSTPSPAPVGAHEGLHPIFGVERKDIDRVKALAMGQVVLPEGVEEDPMEIMARLVTRRAFEATRPVELQVGDWHPGNSKADTLLSAEDIEDLQDLDWERESQTPLPWGRELRTGVRSWPVTSVLIEGMMLEDIGRPSTLAAHVETALASRDLEIGDPGELPRLTPQGMTTIRKTRRALWNPATCRMIETFLENRDNVIDEDPSASSDERIRHRVVAWFLKLPTEMQDVLVAALGQSGGDGPIDFSPAPGAEDAGALPLDFPPDLLPPAPDWA